MGLHFEMNTRKQTSSCMYREYQVSGLLGSCTLKVYACVVFCTRCPYMVNLQLVN